MVRNNKSSKKANKKATKKTKQLWKKGQSSVYNPEFNKHRLEAKKRASFGNQGKGDLTEAKLAEHNRLTLENLRSPDEELTSVGGDTAVTAFTNCSLPTFSRLLKNWNSGSMLHREMLAVLAAVTDVLKSKDGKETETEYFAALMTTLDVVTTDEEITAVVCLLSLVVKSKRFNENILKAKCEESCDKFIKLLLKYMSSDYCALLRNLLKVVYAFLRVNTSWTKSMCEKLKVVLEFTIHHKPKVRRTAQQIIRSLFVDYVPDSLQPHPGSTVAAEFCISKLESSAGTSVSKNVFYVLSLLEEILGSFPKSSLKLLCETILRVMTLSNSLVTSGCLKTLKGLFDMKPKEDNLPADLNGKIIEALYDYQPNVKESVSLVYWIQLMEIALVNLRQLNEKLCLGHLPKFFSTAIECFQSEKEEVLEIVAYALKNLLHKCVDSSSVPFQQYLLENPKRDNPIHRMFHPVKEALSYQYHRAWRCVLMVLGAFFQITGKHSCSSMIEIKITGVKSCSAFVKCLQSLADMHDSYNFPHIAELEKTIGMAIQHIGPGVVLHAVPLQINLASDKPDFPRSWLLPLLRDYTKKTELLFFVKFLMPLASQLRNKANALQQEKKIVESKLYDLICSQVWSLLPGFCTEPTDLKECFKDIAEILGKLLSKEPANRPVVLSSLRILINKNLENDENKQELAKFSKNYLPILFNLYSTESKDKNEEKIRLAVYETCKAYLQITSKELCERYFSMAFEKMTSVDAGCFLQHSMMDICRAILPYVKEPEIKKIYEHCKTLLKDPNHTTQKKAYSIMNEICSCSSEESANFVKKNLEEIRPLLCGSVSGLKPSTKALRLNILGNIISQLTEAENEFVNSIVPEAVLCTKENSVKARGAAYNLLILIGNTMLTWHPDDQKGAMTEYLKVLLAGLAGSPHLMSATILSIGRVVYEFKDKLDSSLIHMLVENTCLLLTSKSREVVVAAISFLKVLFSVLDTADLAQHVEFMVKSITSISEDHQRHFRFKAKELFTRLIRKFGYEMISKLVPSAYQKQLTNIRKTEERKARKKNVKNDVDNDEDEQDSDTEAFKESKSAKGFDAFLADSDEEMPVDMETEKRPKAKASRKRLKNSDPMLEELGEDDIADFLDPSVNKRLITAKPEKQGTVSTTVKGFPIAEDGRLIISDKIESDAKSKEAKQNDERREILTELGAMFKKGKNKRKYEDSDDDDTNVPYKTTVTKGIHRSLASTSKKQAIGAEFKSQKAGGDMKKGKFDPFAYVPFNRQFLNKRKQVKMKGQFKGIVRGAKKGAAVGVKKKARQARNKKNK